MTYDRGTVLKGPDLFADYNYRPYVCLSDDTHPFSNEEALYAAITTTRRAVAIPLTEIQGESPAVYGGDESDTPTCKPPDSDWA